jgi:hypothetical protein
VDWCTWIHIWRFSCCNARQNLVLTKSPISNSVFKWLRASSISFVWPIIFKSSTYTKIMQNPVEDLLMNTHGQSLLLEYPLFRRNSFNQLYHIHPDCFKPYKDLTNFTQYMLWFVCTFGIEIPSGTFMFISESSDLYKYAVTAFINCKDKWFYIARDINHQKVNPFITGEYASCKSTTGLCVKPCASSLTLYLTTS